MPRLVLLAFVGMFLWAPTAMASSLWLGEKKPRVSRRVGLLFPPPGATIPSRPTFYVGLPKGAPLPYALRVTRRVLLEELRLRLVDLVGVELRVRRVLEADVQHRIIVLEASEPLAPGPWTLQGLPGRTFGGSDPDFFVRDREDEQDESPRWSVEPSLDLSWPGGSFHLHQRAHWMVRVRAEPGAKLSPLAIFLTLQPTGPDSDQPRAIPMRYALITHLDEVVAFGSDRNLDAFGTFGLPLELQPGVRYRLSLRLIDVAGRELSAEPLYFSTSFHRPPRPAGFRELLYGSPPVWLLLVFGLLSGPAFLFAERRRRHRAIFRGDAPQSSDLAFRFGNWIRRSSGSSWGR